jgi:hypothetical protein
VAATIVREHEGIVGVESPGIEGQGSIFFFEFQTIDSNLVPLNDTLRELQSPNHRFSRSAQVSPKSAENPAPPSFYHRALIVDDSHVVRKMLATCVKSQFRHIEHVRHHLLLWSF